MVRAGTDVPGDEKKETGALQDAEERLGAMWKQTAEWQEVWMDQAASILEKRVIIDGLQESLECLEGELCGVTDEDEEIPDLVKAWGDPGVF